MNIGSALDRLIAPIAPRMARNRAKARAELTAWQMRQEFLSTYAAAEVKRLTYDWPKKTTSADMAIVPDIPALNARARAVVRDDAVGASMIRGYRRHVIGRGITPKANARNPETGELLEEFNSSADWWWRQWSTRPWYCDLEGRKSLAGIQRVALSELITVGQCFAVLPYQKRRDMVGLSVQMFEAEQLDTNKTKNAENGNEIRRGVEIDEYGRAVGYWVYAGKHPLNSYRSSGDSVRIKAEDVHHLMDQERIRQTHGVTQLASVLRRMRHLAMYDEYMIVRARMEACIGGVIKMDAQYGTGGIGLPNVSGQSGTDAKQNPEINFEPGMAPRLNPGEDWQTLEPRTPGGTYEPFTQAQLTQIAAGGGLDYATVTRDYSRGVFSSQRQGLLEVWAETDPIQDVVVDLLLRPTWEEFVTVAVLEKRIEAPHMFDSPQWTLSYLAADWSGPAKKWIDPARQAAGAKIALDYKLATRRDLQNEQNRDWREQFDQLAAEKKMADDLGIYLPDAQAKAPKVSPSEPKPRGQRAKPGEQGNTGVPPVGTGAQPRRLCHEPALAGVEA